MVCVQKTKTWLPVKQDWRLNERHYGGLQGLNKADMAKEYGDEQVLIWRRSYDTPPPALEPGDPRLEARDPRYAGVAVPRTECLKDTVARFLPLCRLPARISFAPSVAHWTSPRLADCAHPARACASRVRRHGPLRCPRTTTANRRRTG